MSERYPRPRRLQGSATIGMVAPSGYVAERSRLDAAVRRLESLGHRVVVDQGVAAGWKYFSGTDEERLTAVQRMAADPRIDIVMAVRGGYGLTRILHRLDFAALAETRKIFVGFSDFGVFNLAALAQCGMVSFAGPMAAVDFCHDEPSALTEASFWGLVSNSSFPLAPVSCTHGYPPQHIDGTIWGGTLALVTHLLGTPYFPHLQDGILFLEDINEEPYRVERMFLQLWHAGVLQRQRAILIGDFHNCRPTSLSQSGYAMQDVLQTLSERYEGPLLLNLPFGHIKDKITIPVGGHAVLQLLDGAYQITFSDYNAE
jgi:muramoyltetrapeptide carboxypeptidase